MVPDETAQHADAVVIGDAEGVWEQRAGGRRRSRCRKSTVRNRGRAARLSTTAVSSRPPSYTPISLVQAGRGCRFACDFCSIHAFYGVYRGQRDPEDIVSEMRTLPKRRLVFFVDDNLFWTRDAFVGLMRAMTPLKMRWTCQITIDVARDPILA